MSDHPAPGVGTEARFGKNFGLPLINEAGDVAFTATLTGAEIPPEKSFVLYSETAGGLLPVVQRGTQIHGALEGESVGDFETFGLADDGTIAFIATLEQEGNLASRRQGVWSNRSGELSVVAISGQPAPGVEAESVYASAPSFRTLTINAKGDVAFVAKLSGKAIVPSNDIGIWETSGDIASLAVREGTELPSPLDGSSLFGLAALGFSFDDDGEIVFASAYRTTIDEQLHGGHFRLESGVITPILFSNQVAPNLEGGGFTPTSHLSWIGRPLTNNAGDAAFQISIVDDIGGAIRESVLYLEKTGELRPILRVPKNESPLEDGDFTAAVAINLTDDGGVLFYGEKVVLTGNADTVRAYWYTDGLTATPLATLGGQAPGYRLGVVFSGTTDTGFTSNGIGGNGAERFMIRSHVEGPGIDGTNDLGLWLADKSGRLELVLREGMIVDVDDDPAKVDLRRIAAFDLALAAGASAGSGSVFNTHGEFATRLVFYDGSTGVFVITVPEPITIFLLAAIIGVQATIRGNRERMC
ncbi:MAG: hypothetical protein KDA61_05965 [Planctomycetales bacterium]|nr:hypothetical protein [Planctomycetales bacterium]